MRSPEPAGAAPPPLQASSESPAIRPAQDARSPLVVLVPPGPKAPGAARTAVSHWLDGAAGAAALADIQLVLSELVTNSVRHAGIGQDDLITVRARTVDGRVRLEVEDTGAGGVVRGTATVSPAGGFGLNLVELLSERWGVSSSHGTRVWAELPLPPRPRRAGARTLSPAEE